MFKKRCAYSTAQGASCPWMYSYSCFSRLQSRLYDQFWNSAWRPCGHCKQGLRDAEQADVPGRRERDLRPQDWSLGHPHLLGRLQPHLWVCQESGGQLLLHESGDLDLRHGTPKPEEWFCVCKHAWQDHFGNAARKKLLLHTLGQVLPVLQSWEPGVVKTPINLEINTNPGFRAPWSCGTLRRTRLRERFHWATQSSSRLL